MKCEPTYVNNTNHLHKTMTGATLLISNDRELGCINVHVVDQISTGATTGYTLPPINSLIIDRTSYNAGPTATLAHEIGHALGLVHTHNYSWMHFRCFTECVSRTRTWPFFNYCFRTRLKNVCESTGDALRDTPADPNLIANNSCFYNLGGSDPWGDPYPGTGSEAPETANIMSYNGDDACISHFSRLQIAVMLRTIKWQKNGSDGNNWKDSKYTFDSYEPDNNSEIARAIVLNEIQERNFHQQYEYNGLTPTSTQCDEDWVRFTPVCSGTFTVETSAMSGRTNANTRLTLLDNGLTQLAQNDDISSSNQFSSISYSFASGNTYLIHIENMSNGTTGYYQLAVKYTPVINESGSLCSQSTYTISNLPSGATVTWTASPAIVTPATATGNPVTFTRLSDGDFTLTAQITACTQTFTVNRQIHVGPPTLSASYNYSGNVVPMQIYSGTSSYNSVCNLQTTNTVMQVSGATSVVWSKITSSPTSVGWSQAGNDLSFYLWSINQTAVFRIEASNGCGTTTYDFGFKSVDCGGGGGGCAKYTVSASKSSLRIVQPNVPPPCRVAPSDKDSTNGKDLISLVKVYDISGRLRLSEKFNNTESATINTNTLISGVYIIEIWYGKEVERQKVTIIR